MAALKILQQNIKYLRQSFGLSQSQLAERLGCEKSDIGGWETRFNPKLEDIIRLADYFGVTIDDLVRKDLQKQRTSKKQSSLKNARL